VRGKAQERLILRRLPAGERLATAAAGLETEAAVIAAVAALGVPVPPLHYVLQPADGCGSGFITGYVEGETIARKILRDAAFAAIRPHLAFELGRILARIHAVPAAGLPRLEVTSPASTLDAWERMQTTDDIPRPVFELARHWLRDHLPAQNGPPRLVHGDFRHGNLIISPDGVQAVLDWEFVHLGDPMEDLGWVCCMPWRFGAHDAPVGGFGQREQLFAGYASEGGIEVDPESVRWWEMFGSLNWGAGCSNPASPLRTGAGRPVERAMIGRRASESEIDLLRMLLLGD
jgi:aminoglycoside phosphotransferase (APT) family kinase protein